MTTTDFIKEFGLLADAPNGVQKLREMILQLAVQGKLVPQDPDDEPASVLLDRVRAEEKQHIRERRIKKRKPLPPLNHDEASSRLPNGWALARLGNAARLRRGFDLPTKKRMPGAIPVYGANGPLGFHDEVGVKGPGVVTGRSGSIGKVHYVESDFWPLNTALYVEDFNGNDPRFAELLLRTVGLQRFSSYSAVPTLNRNTAHNAQVMVPPLAEQKRIVAKVDELMRLCDELEGRKTRRDESRIALNASCLSALVRSEATAPNDVSVPTTRRTRPPEWAKHFRRIRDNFDILYDNPATVAELRKTILQLAVQGRLVPQDPNDVPAAELLRGITVEVERLSKNGKTTKRLPPIRPTEMPYELPEGWEWTRVGDLALSFQNGLSKRSGATGIETVVLRLADIGNGRVSAGGFRRIRLSDDERARYSVKASDILVTRVNGSIDLVGSFNLITSTEGHCYCDHFVRARAEHGMIVMSYVELFGRSRLCRDQIEEKFITTAGQKTVNQGHLSLLIVPLPPLAEQKRIVAKVDELMRLCDELADRLSAVHEDADTLLTAAVHHICGMAEATA